MFCTWYLLCNLIKYLESLGAFSYTAFGAMLFFFSSLILTIVSLHVRYLRAESALFSFILIFLFNCTDYLTFYIAFESLLIPTLFFIAKNKETSDFPRAATLLVLFSFFTMFFFYYLLFFYTFIFNKLLLFQLFQ